MLYSIRAITLIQVPRSYWPGKVDVGPTDDLEGQWKVLGLQPWQERSSKKYSMDGTVYTGPKQEQASVRPGQRMLQDPSVLGALYVDLMD